MINKELAKTIFIDGQIIGARQMLDQVQGKPSREISFEEYWKTIMDVQETVDELEDKLLNRKS